MRYYCSWAGMGGHDALAPPQKKGRTNDPTSMYDEFEDELEEIHDNGVEILVVRNLDARIELEFSMYEIYEVTDLEKNESISHCNSELSIANESGTTAKFNIILW